MNQRLHLKELLHRFQILSIDRVNLVHLHGVSFQESSEYRAITGDIDTVKQDIIDLFEPSSLNQLKAKADFLGLSVDEYQEKYQRDCPGSCDCQEFIDCAYPDCVSKADQQPIDAVVPDQLIVALNTLVTDFQYSLEMQGTESPSYYESLFVANLEFQLLCSRLDGMALVFDCTSPVLFFEPVEKSKLAATKIYQDYLRELFDVYDEILEFHLSESGDLGRSPVNSSGVVGQGGNQSALELLTDYIAFVGDYATAMPSESWVKSVRALVQGGN